MIRVADYIANYLKEIGVETVFLLSGGGMMHLTDGLLNSKLRYICNHHEHASGIAAIGYAKTKKDIGVCYATSGPGSTNIVTAIAEAWLDSTPVLFITGQSKVSQTVRNSHINNLRQYGMFEIDILPIVTSITKYAAFVDKSSSIKYHLKKAIFTAKHDRPGPVLLDIPLDVQGAYLQDKDFSNYSYEADNSYIDSNDLKFVMEKLTQAKRPILLLGNGMRYTSEYDKINLFFEKINIPIVTTPLAKDVIAYNNILFVGHAGLKGDRAGNLAVQHSDLIISMGNSFHVSTVGWDPDCFAPEAYKIQIEIDNSVLEKAQNLCLVHKQIHAELSCFIDAFAKYCSENNYKSNSLDWKNRCITWKSKYQVINESHKIDNRLFNIYEFIDILAKYAKSGDIIVTDAGSAYYAMGQAFKIKSDQLFLSSGGFGAMGHALPLAIGSAVAKQGSRVICVTGDGSLHMNIQEMETLKKTNANIKLFILNNNGYLSIRNTQDSFFNGNHIGSDTKSGCSLPNYENIIKAYDIRYYACYKSNKDTVLQSVFKEDGPIVCEVFCLEAQAIIPTVSSIKLPDGTMKSSKLNEMYPFIEER